MEGIFGAILPSGTSMAPRQGEVVIGVLCNGGIRMIAKMWVCEDDIERIALQMARRFDEAAAWIAYELAEIADGMHDEHSSERWHAVASAIEQLRTAAV